MNKSKGYTPLWFVLVAMLLFGIIPSSNTVKAYVVPNLILPFDRNFYPDGIQLSSGPHAPSSTFTQAVVSNSIASGIDFSGRPYQDCNGDGNVGECGWQVLSMSAGEVTFMGLTNSSLGNVVVVKVEGFEAYIMYAHLYGFSSEVQNDYIFGDRRIAAGTPLGIVGGTGSGGVKVWDTHLHIDLRSTGTCTQYCISGTNVLGASVSQIVGNPLSWFGQYIDGYTIYPYCADTSCSTIYNYDGVAVRSYWGTGPATPRSDFYYNDEDARDIEPDIYRYPARVFGLAILNCTSGVVCENTNLIPSQYQDDIIFSGKGILGAGGQVESTNALNPNGAGSGGNGGGSNPQPGNSDIDLWEHSNFSGGQYGSACNASGIVNEPNYHDNTASSIEVLTGCSVLIFDGANGTGAKKCLNSTVANLSNVYMDDGVWANDRISSFQPYSGYNCGGNMAWGVEPGDMVTIHDDIDYQGSKYGLHDVGVIVNLPVWPRSIGTTSGWSALLYDGQNGSGGQACISWSDQNFSDNYFHDGLTMQDGPESMQLFHNGNCNGWTPPVIPTVTSVPTVTPIPTVTPVPPPATVLNGSFESVSGDFAQYWARSQNTVTVDTGSHGNNGVNSLHFAPNSANSNAYATGVAVSFGSNYTWSSYVVTTAGTGEVAFYIDEYDVNGNWVNGQWKGNRFENTTETVVFSYSPSNAQVAFAALQYIVVGATTFDVYIDSVVFP